MIQLRPPMIRLSPWKPLNINRASQPDRGAFLSAASGLVEMHRQLYIVADDENFLGVFPLDDEPGYLQRLLPGVLPLSYEERKAEKPDFECLTLIPPTREFPNGALMALGSGSKKTRRRGTIIAFDENQMLGDQIHIIDLEEFHSDLKDQVGKLNIEGAVIRNDKLLLFQRGNKKNRFNGLLSLPLTHFFGYLLPGQASTPLALDITDYNLGDINGVPLCFTDATCLPNGDLIFTAAAEDTEDAYQDGKTLGSAIGAIDAAGRLLFVTGVEQTVKLEGISARMYGTDLELLVVSDADDASSPAFVYRAQLPNYLR